MKSDDWSIDRSAAVYAVEHWGAGYFSINEKGHVCVRLGAENATAVDLHDVAESLAEKPVSLPVLLRFPDLLRDRIRLLQAAFDSSCRRYDYRGHYTPVYPIKVNQQGSVVENILSTDRIGLEAGSKPELLAILGLSNEATIVCNGYKDRAYIRLALIGSLMKQQSGQTGKERENKLYIVIEKPSELVLIAEEAAKLQIKPALGVRIRLASISTGKWQNSGGEKSKFGLHANELLKLIEQLRREGLLECLQLLHFHMGSQVANIHDIKSALKEAAQFFLQLHVMGVNIQVVDAGGGLGVDYDGSASRRECSINYSLNEYADNIVGCFAEICATAQIPHPDIITESGRAITAHHALLLTQVTDIETPHSLPHRAKEPSSMANPVERWHNLQFDLSQARTRFVQGDLTLAELAETEQQYILDCHAIKLNLDPANHNQREILRELDEKLADKIFCNFSLFQSMPDIWGIDQIFPIMPIHRLDQQPTKRGVIQDLTCDSDGRIDQYIDHQNIESTLPLHEIRASETYIIGFFMLGAYQEILGDMHNLFGDTHSFNVEADGAQYRISDFHAGEQVSDLLEYVHIDVEKLKLAYRHHLEQSDLPVELRQGYLQELIQGLTAYTYLEK